MNLLLFYDNSQLFTKKPHRNIKITDKKKKPDTNPSNAERSESEKWSLKVKSNAKFYFIPNRIINRNKLSALTSLKCVFLSLATLRQWCARLA